MDTIAIEREIKRVKAKILTLDDQINLMTGEKIRNENYLAGLEFGLKSSTKNPSTKKQELRQGSELAKVRDILKQSGKALHIDEILKLLGNEDKSKKTSLASTLNSYARKENVFIKTPPNTFGLIECNYETNEIENIEIT